jgi:hypothetical protein
VTALRKSNGLGAYSAGAVKQVHGTSTRAFDNERVQDSSLTLNGPVPVFEDQVVILGESFVKI